MVAKCPHFSRNKIFLENYVGNDWKNFSSNFVESDTIYKKYQIGKNKHNSLYLIDWKTTKYNTAIHNHPKKGCYMKILKGSLLEKRFSPLTLEKKGEYVYTKNDVTYICDKESFHSIEPLEDNTFSLHVYDKE